MASPLAPLDVVPETNLQRMRTRARTRVAATPADGGAGGGAAAGPPSGRKQTKASKQQAAAAAKEAAAREQHAKEHQAKTDERARARKNDVPGSVQLNSFFGVQRPRPVIKLDADKKPLHNRDDRPPLPNEPLLDWSLKAEYKKGGLASKTSKRAAILPVPAEADGDPTEEAPVQPSAHAAADATATKEPQQQPGDGGEANEQLQPQAGGPKEVTAGGAAHAGPLKKPQRVRHAWEFYVEDVFKQVLQYDPLAAQTRAESNMLLATIREEVMPGHMGRKGLHRHHEWSVASRAAGSKSGRAAKTTREVAKEEPEAEEGGSGGREAEAALGGAQALAAAEAGEELLASSEAWFALNKEDKNKYLDMWEADQKRYEAELTAYREALAAFKGASWGGKRRGAGMSKRKASREEEDRDEEQPEVEEGGKPSKARHSSKATGGGSGAGKRHRAAPVVEEEDEDTSDDNSSDDDAEEEAVCAAVVDDDSSGEASSDSEEEEEAPPAKKQARAPPRELQYVRGPGGRVVAQVAEPEPAVRKGRTRQPVPTAAKTKPQQAQTALAAAATGRPGRGTGRRAVAEAVAEMAVAEEAPAADSGQTAAKPGKRQRQVVEEQEVAAEQKPEPTPAPKRHGKAPAPPKQKHLEQEQDAQEEEEEKAALAVGRRMAAKMASRSGRAMAAAVPNEAPPAGRRLTRSTSGA